MSALAHAVESRGLPTTVVALIKEHAVAVRPPRALAVPFMLGRPFGAPDAPALQRAVLVAALGLLERTDGPVILESFAGADPGSVERTGWQPAVALSAPAEPDSAQQWASTLQAELDRILPAWARAKARTGRTTVGLAGQAPDQFPAFAAQLLMGQRPTVPAHHSAALAMRFMADDLKALYGEAAQADGNAVSAQQVDGWFWRQTQAGRLLIALRAASQRSEDTAIKTVGGRFLVPVKWLPTT